jgi:hypothetical protein
MLYPAYISKCQRSAYTKQFLTLREEQIASFGNREYKNIIWIYAVKQFRILHNEELCGAGVAQ